MNNRDKRDLIDKLLIQSVISSAPLRPGAVIEKMSKEDRERLKKLSSMDYKQRL